jgi:hypothetical protein
MASAFKVEKGVPLAPGGQMGPATRYPWDELEVGDSFYAPLSAYQCRTGEPSVGKYLASMQRVASQKRRGTFRVRREGEGLRVWRIA